jgi:hypothetical protein
MTNKQRAKTIKKIIGYKNKKIIFTRPADILANVMHYCDHYFDDQYVIETAEKFKYDFENELMIAQDYYNDEKLEEETA